MVLSWNLICFFMFWFVIRELEIKISFIWDKMWIMSKKYIFKKNKYCYVNCKCVNVVNYEIWSIKWNWYYGNFFIYSYDVFILICICICCSCWCSEFRSKSMSVLYELCKNWLKLNSSVWEYILWMFKSIYCIVVDVKFKIVEFKEDINLV